MGLHPAERVREYRDNGFWTDDMIDALLRERVARDGDIPALVDPLNRATRSRSSASIVSSVQ